MFNPGDLVRLKPEYWTWYRGRGGWDPLFSRDAVILVALVNQDSVLVREYTTYGNIGVEAHVPFEYVELAYPIEGTHCSKCGQKWMVHNDDGSCVED